MDKATLDRHLQYTAWATNHLLTAIADLPAEDLERDFKTADRTIVATLAHIFGADRIWLDRVSGRPRNKFMEDHERDLGVLREHWPRIHHEWRQWLSSYMGDLNVPIAYSDLKGNPFTSTPIEIILHVVNHGTHHRGQVSGFLRALGRTPPALDLIRFYRGL